MCTQMVSHAHNQAHGLSHIHNTIIHSHTHTITYTLTHLITHNSMQAHMHSLALIASNLLPDPHVIGSLPTGKTELPSSQLLQVWGLCSEGPPGRC